ncbi:MAG TPA: tripartite tricarboxylate transporter substrate-binding protein, partial [Myxococcaceae bacterium]|nr:tripartite tricarboxylate transporter substrate-binding protein [Myxococcaceae bacterium]
PRETVEKLNATARRALQAEEVRRKLLDSGAEPSPSSPQQLSELIRADSAKWARIIREQKIKGE